MKLPKHVQIGPHKIPVKRTKSLHTTADAFGLFDPNTMEIQIDAGTTDSHQLEVLMHEIIEAANTMYEMGLEHRNIQTIGVVLAQVFGDWDTA
jgi:hypothetical protein